MAVVITWFASLLAALASCDIAERRQCIADDCTCASDDECVIEDCYFATLPHEGVEGDCGGVPCSCYEECDCTNGYPLPARVAESLAAAGAGDCGYYYCEGSPGPCDCFTDTVTYEPRCEWGKCVGVPRSD